MGNIRSFFAYAAVLPTAAENGKMEGGKDRSEVLVPFSPGESLRVYRLQGKGLALDLERGLTEPNMPLREAWVAFLTQQAMGRATYVLYDAQYGEAFIQVQYRPHQAVADVAYMAPSLASCGHANAGRAWSRLLDGVSVEVAARGIQRLFASLPEAGPAVRLRALAFLRQRRFQSGAGLLSAGQEPASRGALGKNAENQSEPPRRRRRSGDIL